MSSNLTFNRAGWLDLNDPIYWEKTQGRRFHLVNHSTEDAETVSLYLNIPNEGFEQLHALLREHKKRLQEINVHVASEEDSQVNKVQIELKFKNWVIPCISQ